MKQIINDSTTWGVEADNLNKNFNELIDTNKFSKVSEILSDDNAFVYGNTIFKIYNPYAKTKQHTLKGQMHCHTTNSDGAYTPLKVCQDYENAGYHFIAITDHNYITPEPVGNNLIWLADSYESTSMKTDGYHAHLCIYGAMDVLRTGTSMTETNKTINEVLTHHSVNGFSLVSLAHPNWVYSGYVIPDETFEEMRGAINFVDAWCDSSPVAGELLTCCRAWDILLTRGIRVFGLATDDYHTNQFGDGWVEVFVDALTSQAIIESLAEGNFYAAHSASRDHTDGITITDISLIGKDISVTLSDSATIRFIGLGGNLLKSETATTSTYNVTGNEKYVRIEIWNGENAKWLQPFFIDNVKTYNR